MGDTQKDSYFQQVFESYSKDIFRYIYAKLSRYESAEDLTSEVFIKFWKIVCSQVSIQNERALLYTIAHGLVIDEYRKNKRNSVSIDGVNADYFGKEDTTEQDIDVKEAINTLYKKLTCLKAEYQDVLLLYYIEEIEIPEIAEILHKKEGTVRVLVHRALSALKTVYV